MEDIEAEALPEPAKQAMFFLEDNNRDNIISIILLFVRSFLLREGSKRIALYKMYGKYQSNFSNFAKYISHACT